MLSVATFNVCNLNSAVPPQRLHRLAEVIAHDLAGPDILAVQEISASVKSPAYGGRVPAPETYLVLIQAILAAGGPHYAFREVPPLADRDGGQTGLNIRTGFLFNAGRVRFEDRGTAGPEDATSIRIANACATLTLNPGRIAPHDPAFEGDRSHHWLPSRKALAAEFRVGNEKLFLIACHLKSQRSIGRREAEYAKKQRQAQATVIYRFVRTLLTCVPDAQVIVLGDMNDVTGSKTLKILAGDLLSNLLEEVPKNLRYTRLHCGRRQTLDHVLVSRSLHTGAHVHIPHVNSHASDPYRASDHDPVLVQFADNRNFKLSFRLAL